MNRLANSRNKYQGKFKRVLCICSAGLLRSPTAAVVLASEPYNFNTRAAGLDSDFALITVDEVLLNWADEIVCMNPKQESELVKIAPKGIPVISLEIPDNYEYRNPKLMTMIRERYDAEQIKIKSRK